MSRPIAAMVADIHWSTRTPEYRVETCPFTEVTAKKLRFMFDFCNRHRIPVFGAGDLFERSRDFMDWWTLSRFLDEEQLIRHKMWVVQGQHDRFHHNANDPATSLNAIVGDDIGVFLLPEDGVGISTKDKLIRVYGCGWGEPYPVPHNKGANHVNILVLHKTLWHKAPPYPGLSEGNVSAESVKLHDLGYSMVFSGDNHKAFDVTVGGVEFHNLGAFTRTNVLLADQKPRFCVLYEDLSVDTVYVGGTDVFDIGRSDADKGREDTKDGFSEALAGGFEYGMTFKQNLEHIVSVGKCADLVFNDQQKNLLRDIINAI